MPTKRQRVSHYKKPAEPSNNPPPAENKSQRRPATDSRDSSNMNPRSRESPSTTSVPPSATNGHHVTNGYTNGVQREKRSALSDDEEDENNAAPNRKRRCDSFNKVGGDYSRQEAQTRSPYENAYVKRELVDYSTLECEKDVFYKNGEAYPNGWPVEPKGRLASTIAMSQEPLGSVRTARRNRRRPPRLTLKRTKVQNWHLIFLRKFHP